MNNKPRNKKREIPLTTSQLIQRFDSLNSHDSDSEYPADLGRKKRLTKKKNGVEESNNSSPEGKYLNCFDILKSI